MAYGGYDLRTPGKAKNRFRRMVASYANNLDDQCKINPFPMARTASDPGSGRTRLSTEESSSHSGSNREEIDAAEIDKTYGISRPNEVSHFLKKLKGDETFVPKRNMTQNNLNIRSPSPLIDTADKPRRSRRETTVKELNLEDDTEINEELQDANTPFQPNAQSTPASWFKCKKI